MKGLYFPGDCRFFYLQKLVKGMTKPLQILPLA